MTGAPGYTSVLLLGAACLAPTPYLSPSPPLSLSLNTMRKQQRYDEYGFVKCKYTCTLGQNMHFITDSSSFNISEGTFGVKGGVASCFGVFVILYCFRLTGDNVLFVFLEAQA